jgi:hypothetical protein
MDENTWRFAQMILWIIGIQTTVIIAAFGGFWLLISKRFDAIEKRLDQIERRLDKLEEKVNNIDRRVIAIETMLHMKEGCYFKDEKQMKKVE